MIRRMTIFAAALIVFLICCVEHAETQDESNDPVEKLLSSASKKRLEGKKEILEQRKKLIERLLKLVKDPELKKKNRAAVVAAIELLGELRAEEAVPVFMNMLLFAAREDVYDREDDPRDSTTHGLPYLPWLHKREQIAG